MTAQSMNRAQHKTAGRAVAIALAGALAALLLAPALAGACEDPKLTLNKESAAAGESVGFSIINVQEGGSYTVKVDGRPVATGTSPGTAGLSGSFSMPDLGASRAVSVDMLVTHVIPAEPKHGGGDPPSSQSILFVVAAPSSADASGQAGAEGLSQGGSVPAAQSAQPSTATQQPASAPQATAPVSAATGAATAATPARERARAKATRTAPRRASSTPQAPRRATAPAHSARSGGSLAATGRALTAAPAHRARGAQARVSRGVAAIPAAGTVGLAGASQPRAIALQGDELPVTLLLTIAALLCAGLAGAGRARVTAGRAHPAPVVPAAAPQDTEELHVLDIETELQQLLAEEASRGASPAAEPEPAKHPV